LRIIEIYIINSQLSDKRKIISTLARSLLGLAPSALILNLCTIVKPIFSQSNYTTNFNRKIENAEEEEEDDNVKQIKVKIENWIKDLKLQSKDIKKIEYLKKKVNKQASKYAKEYKLNKDSDEFNQILKEAQDMLEITFTAISLATTDENK
jgi:tRNA-dihydrouridine synthase